MADGGRYSGWWWPWWLDRESELERLRDRAHDAEILCTEQQMTIERLKQELAAERGARARERERDRQDEEAIYELCWEICNEVRSSSLYIAASTTTLDPEH